jgi:cytoskeletal protein RodZ
MNRTIKGIIIVAAITSMLVLGAGMFPIMQNSFAERDPNTNTNTNSADSTSSSNATTSNTNNINNTATASQSQEQDACAVAITCPEGTTTVTVTTPCNPPTVGGQIAIPTDDTCIARLPAGSTLAQLRAFENDCLLIPTSTLIIRPDNSATCTFSLTPPT